MPIKTWKAVLVEPNEKPRIIDIAKTLGAFQMHVGGYIETIHLDTETIMVVNEEGAFLPGFPLNRWVNDMPIYGNIVIIGHDRKNFDFADLRDPGRWVSVFECEEVTTL